MKEFVLPELGENIESASVLKVMINKGDYLKADQTVLEIETDKATIEVPSTVEGIVTDVFVKDGDKITIGQVLLRVEESAPKGQVEKEIITLNKEAIVKSADKKITPDAKQKQDAVKIVEFVLPDLGENIQSADIRKVLVKVGDTINKDDLVLEIETDKATIEVPSTVSGKIIELFVKDGGKAEVGQSILRVESTMTAEIFTEVKIQETEDIAATKPEPVVQQQTPKPEENVVKSLMQRRGFVDTQPAILPHSAPAAPSVRRLARELGVDINAIPGSGQNGRISLPDVKSYVKILNENRITANASSAGIGIKAETLPDFSKFGSIERKPMSNIRAKTADHLGYAWAVIPHVTQFDKADITDLEKVRKGLASSAEKEGTKLTVTAFLLKIISAALKEFPQFNSSVDMERSEIIYKNYINVGVAVDTENGLMVPVVKNADGKNIFQLSREINELADKARRRKIGLDDLQGGCFSISNLGGIGGTYFTPIVNSPEVAILGVSRGSYEPIYMDGQFVPRMMLPLSLSYDHRVIDGADAIRFLRKVIADLENPYRFLTQ